MKTLRMFYWAQCYFCALVVLLCSCSQNEDHIYTHQEVLSLVSDRIEVSTDYMSSAFLRSTDLGNFQSLDIVDQSIQKDGHYMMVAVDKSVYSGPNYDFMSFEHKISGEEGSADLVMIVPVEKEVLASINIMSDARGVIVDLPKLKWHCVGMGVCMVIPNGAGDCGPPNRYCGCFDDDGGILCPL